MKKSILRQMSERGEKSDDKSEVISPLKVRKSTSVVANVGKTLSHLSEDSIISLNPDKVEPSPFRDRFDLDAESNDRIEELKVSIQSEGQKMPVLARVHPTKPDFYQLAYGRRRLEAIKRIKSQSNNPEKIMIRAYVRELTDRELLQEQSLENGLRENLTWIEQAMWAYQLKNAGFINRAICPILGVNESSVSMLLSVAEKIPHDIVKAIGRAKGAGRPKWISLAELLNKDDKAQSRVRMVLSTSDFKEADSAERLKIISYAAIGLENNNRPKKNEERLVKSGPRTLATIRDTRAGTVFSIANNEKGFARWLENRMDTLMKEFEKEEFK